MADINITLCNITPTVFVEARTSSEHPITSYIPLDVFVKTLMHAIAIPFICMQTVSDIRFVSSLRYFMKIIKTVYSRDI